MKTESLWLFTVPDYTGCYTLMEKLNKLSSKNKGMKFKMADIQRCLASGKWGLGALPGCRALNNALNHTGPYKHAKLPSGFTRIGGGWYLAE